MVGMEAVECHYQVEDDEMEQNSVLGQTFYVMWQTCDRHRWAWNEAQLLELSWGQN